MVFDAMMGVVGSEMLPLIFHSVRDLCQEGPDIEVCRISHGDL
jgi:hypothetical protein